jgi:hypothetical protein
MKNLLHLGGLVLAWAVVSASAQTVRYGTCAIDLQVVQLPDCAVSAKGGRVYVSAKFARDVFSKRAVGVAAVPVQVEGRRLAWTEIYGRGWVYFDRTGLVVVEHVAIMDNGADQFHRGLIRVTRYNKWGLADLKGKLVVPMQYDGLLTNPSGSGWLACAGCTTVSDGEHSWPSGGTWSKLDSNGKVIERITAAPASRVAQ